MRAGITHGRNYIMIINHIWTTNALNRCRNTLVIDPKKCQLDVSHSNHQERNAVLTTAGDQIFRPSPQCIMQSLFVLMNTKAMNRSPQRVPCQTRSKPDTSLKYIYFFFWLCSCSFSTFLTIFCSSIKKARTIRSRTQPPHLDPP